MKRPLSFGVVPMLLAVVMLAGGAPSDSQDRDALARIPEQFIGAWRLVSLEVTDADGKVHSGDSTGMFVFTREGRLAVQVMDRTPPAVPHDGPEQYAQGGYEATFGRFEVDERTHTFTYYVEGALVRTLVGKALPRVYEFKGNQLIVKSANPAERWRAVWGHY
jgi:Lipocalin-like domain